MNVGQKGEEYAREYLREKGFRIITSNFHARGGEIDIICKSGDTLVFVEVKTRTSDIKGKPYEAVTFPKLLHLKHAAFYYITSQNIQNASMRIDVVSIELNADQSIRTLQHFENVEMV